MDAESGAAAMGRNRGLAISTIFVVEIHRPEVRRRAAANGSVGKVIEEFKSIKGIFFMQQEFKHNSNFVLLYMLC